MQALSLYLQMIQVLVGMHRYGYGEQVKQDEGFVDGLLQQISIMLFNELQDCIHSTPALQSTIKALPPPRAGISSTSTHRPRANLTAFLINQAAKCKSTS